MGIDKANLEDVSWSDLEELVEGGVPEALRLEYKREPYGGSDDDKRELLKDVSALANSSGGHLIIGIAAIGGCAETLGGLDKVVVDAEVLRMESIIRSSVEPRIVGLQMQAVTSDSGRTAIVIRVQRSWNGPHRVTFKGLNKFYVRGSASVNEASVEELRTMFTQAGSALDQAREFRRERLLFVSGAFGARPLAGPGRLVLHIVPVASLSSSTLVDLVHAKKNQQKFRPIGLDGSYPQFNFEGFAVAASREANLGYTQIFRNGCFESAKGDVIRVNNGRRLLFIRELEREFFDVFEGYLNGLRDLNVPPPFILMITIEGAAGAHITLTNSFSTDRSLALPLHLLHLPECVVEDYGDALVYQRAIQPAFDALWNAGGYERDPFFSVDGRWNGANA